jgi:hypothetical protein
MRIDKVGCNRLLEKREKRMGNYLAIRKTKTEKTTLMVLFNYFISRILGKVEKLRKLNNNISFLLAIFFLLSPIFFL